MSKGVKIQSAVSFPLGQFSTVTVPSPRSPEREEVEVFVLQELNLLVHLDFITLFHSSFFKTSVSFRLSGDPSFTLGSEAFHRFSQGFEVRVLTETLIFLFFYCVGCETFLFSFLTDGNSFSDKISQYSKQAVISCIMTG